MKNRIKLTENEKIAQTVIGMNNEHTHFNMNEDNLQEQFDKIKKIKHNEQVDEYVEKFNQHQEFLEKYAESFKDNMGTIEIKPMGSRILMKPFEHNPFQRITVENGIITDLGGQTPTYFNTDNGKVEEEKEFIKTGVIVETGPDCKYIKEGDVVFYRTDMSIPVPFFKQGLYTITEGNIIAIVNEGLTERFNSLK